MSEQGRIDNYLDSLSTQVAMKVLCIVVLRNKQRVKAVLLTEFRIPVDTVNTLSASFGRCHAPIICCPTMAVSCPT